MHLRQGTDADGSPIAAIVVPALAAVAAAIWYVGYRPGDATKSGTVKAAASQDRRADPSLRAIPVVAAPARQGSLDIYLHALGTVTPLNAVVVRSRVDGQLMRVAFTEGQMVAAGTCSPRSTRGPSKCS